MNIYLTFLFLIFGLALLVKGADIFVDAGSGIARNFKVPPFIIGLTVLAFGTSAPEVFIGVRAALTGTDALALAMGNVIGSNILNLILIIGIGAVIKPIALEFKRISTDFWISLSGPALLLIALLFFETQIPRIFSGILLLVFSIYSFYLLKKARKNRTVYVGEPLDTETKSLTYNIIFALIGLIAIVVGGEVTVHNAIQIANVLGMSPRMVGLTIVAIGTSLPELLIVIVASRRGKEDLAVGNIVGSSIFNILFIIGITGIITPLPIDSRLFFDLIFLLGSSLIFLIFILTKNKLSRFEGSILIMLYLIYITVLTILN